jgi:hypothetical protein
MLRHVIRVLCILALAVRAAFGQAAGVPETLSADDRELVRLFLELSLKERAGWSADSAVLLDSTRQLCDGSARRDCLNPTLLDDLTLPSATALMPECARVDYPTLRKAFVDRNIRTWRIGAFQTPLTIASGSQVRAMSQDGLLGRFAGRRFIEVNAPAYDPGGRFALVFVRGFCAFDCSWSVLQVFERRVEGWTPVHCGIHVTA